jgi:hypothetical protein
MDSELAGMASDFCVPPHETDAAMSAAVQQIHETRTIGNFMMSSSPYTSDATEASAESNRVQTRFSDRGLVPIHTVEHCPHARSFTWFGTPKVFSHEWRVARTRNGSQSESNGGRFSGNANHVCDCVDNLFAVACLASRSINLTSGLLHHATRLRYIAACPLSPVELEQMNQLRDPSTSREHFRESLEFLIIDRLDAHAPQRQLLFEL